VVEGPFCKVNVWSLSLDVHVLDTNTNLTKHPDLMLIPNLTGSLDCVVWQSPFRPLVSMVKPRRSSSMIFMADLVNYGLIHN